MSGGAGGPAPPGPRRDVERWPEIHPELVQRRWQAVQQTWRTAMLLLEESRRAREAARPPGACHPAFRARRQGLIFDKVWAGRITAETMAMIKASQPGLPYFTEDGEVIDWGNMRRLF